MTTYTLTELFDKRNELAGEILQAEKRARQLRADLAHVEATRRSLSAKQTGAPPSKRPSPRASSPILNREASPRRRRARQFISDNSELLKRHYLHWRERATVRFRIVPNGASTLPASMWLAGVIIGCVGGYTVVAARQDERGPLKNRLVALIGYLLTVVGLGLFIAGMWR